MLRGLHIGDSRGEPARSSAVLPPGAHGGGPLRLVPSRAQEGDHPGPAGAFGENGTGEDRGQSGSRSAPLSESVRGMRRNSRCGGSWAPGEVPGEVRKGGGHWAGPRP